MTVLVDHEINARLKATPPLATGVPVDDFKEGWSRVQASSLSLTIGEIFTPNTGAEEPGGWKTPLRELTLMEGHTAVLRTSETLNLGADLVAMAFPPASVSLKGLLMTNPGQVDPGYSGPLHLTVINMGRLPFSLRAGDLIIRVIFMKLSARPSATYSDRHRPSPSIVITSELLGRLSPDFLSVEQRSTEIANSAVTRAGFWSAVISAGIAGALTLLAGVVTIGVPSWLNNSLEKEISDNREKLGKLEARMTVTEGKLNVDELNARLKVVEDAIAKSAGRSK